MTSLPPRNALAALAAVGFLLSADTVRADWVSEQIEHWTSVMEASFAGGNVGGALLLAFVLGLLTSLTPCVYPMIAITVSVFGAKQAKSRLQSAGLSAMFVLGMSVLFTGIGIGVALSGGFFGDWLNNLWVVVGLAAVFVALALSMFGLWELSLPSGLQNRLAKAGGIGYQGAFVIGLAMAPLAAPCVGPPMALLLGLVGGTGDLVLGGAAMFVFSLGLGLLFFAVGTFAVALPKSGRWLEWPKSFFGAVLLVMALYYLGNFLPFRPEERVFTWLAVGLGLTLAGLALGAIHLSFHAARSEQVRKTAGLAMLVAGLTAAMWWVQADPPVAAADAVVWQHDFHVAQAQAEREGRPLLIDFTASWCGACGELDQRTFSDPRVIQALQEQDVIPVKVDMSPDKIDDDRRAILARYQERGGLPLVILHGRDGRELNRITQFVEAERFLDFLSEID